MSDQPQSNLPEGQSPSTGGSANNFGDFVDRTSERTRRYSPGFFGVIALSFLLPFVSIACAGSRVVTMKGLDFVTGAKVEVSEEFTESLDFGEFETGDTEPSTEDVPIEGVEDDRVDRNIFVISALAASILGVILSLVLKRRQREVAATIMAGIVFLGLLIFRVDTANDAEGGEGLVVIEYRIGWWIAIVLAAALLVAHVRGLRASTPSVGKGREP